MKRAVITPDYTISRVIKGCWQLSMGHGLQSRQDHEQAVRDVVTSIRAGFTTLDFGDIYLGVEELVGAALRQLGSDDPPVQLHTKYVPDLAILASHTMDDVRKIIDRSRQRLGVEQLDLVQFHWWDYQYPGYIDAMGDLKRLQDEGAIRLLGVTNFDTQRMQEFIAAGLTPVTAQVQYSALDHRPENGLTALAEEHGISLLCYGTVGGGFLSERFIGMPEPSSPFENRSLAKYKLIIDEFGGWGLFQQLLVHLKQIADNYGVEISTVASSYILTRSRVAGVIVGARDASHLEANQTIDSLVLDTDALKLIRTIVNQCTGPEGDIYDLERNTPAHAGIMQKGNNLNNKPA